MLQPQVNSRLIIVIIVVVILGEGTEGAANRGTGAMGRATRSVCSKESAGNVAISHGGGEGGEIVVWLRRGCGCAAL